MKLYTFFLSSAAYRVRIGLALKGLTYDAEFVHLARDGGEQHRPAYSTLNPERLIPLLVEDEFVLSQSLAILEYLEETHPEPALLPGSPRERARVRALAASVCCDIHPLQNLRVRRYLADELKQDEAAVLRWTQHWIDRGLSALETTLAKGPRGGAFCYGDRPTLADVCLVPQLANAVRYRCDLGKYPTLVAIRDRCNALEAFQRAAPENQPDASAR